MDYLYDDRDPIKYFLMDADLLSYLRPFRDILKITKVSQLKYITKDDLASIGFTRSEIRRYRKTYEKCYRNPYFAQLKGFIIRKKGKILKKRQSITTIDMHKFTEAHIKVPTKHIIAIEDISINVEIGVGQFGVVQQGTWTTRDQRVQVAIKCVGPGMTSNSSEFLKEAAVMHSIDHPNIVRLFGVVLHSDTLMLVTELAPLRSLLECLRDVGLRLKFPVLTLCDFAEQICDGMAYLENKRLIHRDLAARNILVFNKNKVKISDFGLSRALGVGKDYYQTNYNVDLKLPVAWCAPECILYLRFTSASDVWAFGVCLWEMFSYGFKPWAAFSGQKILEAIDKPKCQRLERPDCCPGLYYSLMLNCWSHDPSKRPKFRDLRIRLRAIRPDEVITLLPCNEQEGSHRTNLLDYNEGQVITVLGKEKMTKSTMWYGVIPGGICGMFNPNNTKHYKTPHSRLSVESLSPELEICSPSIPNLLRSDVMRHTYTAKRSIHSDMISGAQDDYNRTGHIGLDETNFGNISFLDPAGCPPRHVLYRPSVDSEQVPLINPNSPSHLKNSTDTQMPYPPKPNQQRKVDYAEIQITSSQTTTKSRGHKKTTKTKQLKEPVKSKNILKRVKNATIGRSHRKDGNNKKITQNNKNEEVHEYQEITEPETEGNTSENSRPENLITPESSATQKESSEFRDTLLEEMESILRNIEQRRKDENASDAEGGNKNNGLKKKTPLGTMKQMSAQEEKTLNTAVAMANEITTKSMNDLGYSYNPSAPPNEKHKLNLIKFGQLSLHNHAPDENDKDSTGKQERRNFSDEAKAKATDIQSTITKESKAAYACLIEEPTPSTSRMVQVAKTATMPKLSTVIGGTNNLMPATMPRPATTLKPTTMPRPATTLKPTTVPRPVNTLQSGNMIRPTAMLGPPVMPKPVTVSSLDAKNIIDIKTGARPKERPIQKIPILKSLQQKVLKTQLSVDETDGVGKNVVNVLPLPPRSEKTLLVDMPRHIRKHPLKIPAKPDNVEPQAIIINHDNVKRITYQNTYSNLDSHVGLNRDGGKFTHKPIKSPTAHLKGFGQTETIRSHGSDDDDVNIIRTLVKDYVSVEDLLEFADLKPCGRQRGFESDEVRIMMKVFYESVTSEQCLEALEFCDWDVHHAIKLLSIKMSVGDYVDLEDCYSELMKARGDITKAVNFLNLQKQCKLLQLST